MQRTLAILTALSLLAPAAALGGCRTPARSAAPPSASATAAAAATTVGAAAPGTAEPAAGAPGAGSLPAAEPAAPLAELPAPVAAAVDEAREAGAPRVALDATVDAGTPVEQVAGVVAGLGGQVTFASPQTGYIQVELPPDAVPRLLERAPVTEMGVDFEVGVRTASAPEPVAAAEARAGLQVNLDAIRGPALSRTAGTYGRGVTIAIIDTGVDPSHPDLQTTMDGGRKLVDYQDFTGEGLVKTNLPVTHVSGAIHVSVPTADGGSTQQLAYRTGGIRSAGGAVRFGLLREAGAGSSVAGPGIDFDNDGILSDSYGVLLVDSQVPGGYDTVYVDTNGNHDFSDEQPLRDFGQAPDTGYLGVDQPQEGDNRTPFVIAGIDPAGQWVSLGFDRSGHGTHVASVAAAWSRDGLQGVAPGARIMVLKALNAQMTGKWLDLVKALYYAADNGADIISISVQNLERATGSGLRAAAQLSEIAARFDKVLVLAGGNNGPGLSSAAVAGDPAHVLTVGGYYSRAMWRRDYHYDLPRDVVWDSSGSGPRPDGGMAPSVIAPVRAPAAVPRWLYPTGYVSHEGTSQAVPHVAGVVALLLEGARRDGLSTDHQVLKQAVELGAGRLDGFALYEQGFGLVNAEQAWVQLQRLKAPPAIRVSGPSGGLGVLSRSNLLGAADFTLTNTGPAIRLNVVSTAEWLKPERTTVAMPRNGVRQLGVSLTPPAQPGVYSALLTLVAPGYEVQLPHTVVVPHTFDGSDRIEILRTGAISGYHTRDFITVPPGTAQLSIRTEVPWDPDRVQFRGRVQFRVFNPEGREVYRSDPLGAGRNPTRQAGSVVLENPMPGDWEVFTYHDPALAQFVPGATTSEYAVTIQRFGLAAAAGSGEPASARLQLSYPNGGMTVSEQVTVQAVLPADFTGHLSAAGWAGPTDSARTYHPELAWTVLEQAIVVRSPVPLARFEALQAVPSGAAVALRLSRLDPQTGEYRTYRAQPREETNPRVLEVKHLPAGTYTVSADVTPVGARPNLFYSRRFFAEGVGMQLADPPRRHPATDRWTVTLELDLPPEPGRYTGYLLLRDAARDQVITWLPVEVSVGQPPLTVRPLAPNLVVGQSGWVTVEVLNPATGGPVDGHVRVNGRQYATRQGQVRVPVLPTEASLPLAVEADMPGFRPASARYTLWAGSRPRVVPISPAAQQESGTWRQKVWTELWGR